MQDVHPCITHADHIYLCKKCSKGRTSIHDAVNKTLCTISNQVPDTTAILEPMHLQEQFGCNPDLVIHTPTNGERQRAVADVVIGCPYQSQTKRKPRRDPGHKTQKAETFLNSLERKKIIKYGRSRAAVLTRRQRERQAQESQTHGEQSERTETNVQRQDNNDIILPNPNITEVASVTTSATDSGQRDQNAGSHISQQGESESQAQQISEGQDDEQTDSVTLESIDSMRRSVAIQYFGVIPVAISTHGAIGQGLSDLLKEFRRRDVTATSEVDSSSGDTSSEDSTVSEKSLYQTSFWRLARLGAALAKGYGYCFSNEIDPRYSFDFYPMIFSSTGVVGESFQEFLQERQVALVQRHHPSRCIEELKVVLARSLAYGNALNRQSFELRCSGHATSETIYNHRFLLLTVRVCLIGVVWYR
ncbi:hypothetical protein ADUPG1_006382 [Aduncisulcus paluster]|uniref:Uncharacterized protein n=1 Tax=Aduncisulcus paluster TaxID=2918883 RepID=A0ABQ5KJS6_9EUKA|nr:hypothetical protein ADUPG1_006382 [Aduncisulcus paluster]